MAQAELEIERKFFIADDTIQKLRAVCPNPKTKNMLDIYWDTGPSTLSTGQTVGQATVPPFTLTSADAWLRSRNDTWELKWPVLSVQEQLRALIARRACADGSVPADQYSEHTDTGEITDKLSTLGVSINRHNEGHSSFADALYAAGLQPFTRIRTVRTRYSLDPAAVLSTPVTSIASAVHVQAEPGTTGTVTLPPLIAQIPAGAILGVDVDEVHYEDVSSVQGGGVYRLAEVEVVLPLPLPLGLSLSPATTTGASSGALPTDSSEKEKAVQVADALIGYTCAVFGIQTDSHTAASVPSAEGREGEGSRGRRIHGKVIEFLIRYDTPRFNACRGAGLLAIKIGEDVPEHLLGAP
jgi:hypothetical protein